MAAEYFLDGEVITLLLRERDSRLFHLFRARALHPRVPDLQARVDKDRELKAAQKDLEAIREQVALKTKEVQDKEESFFILKACKQRDVS